MFWSQINFDKKDAQKQIKSNMLAIHAKSINNEDKITMIPLPPSLSNQNVTSHSSC